MTIEHNEKLVANAEMENEPSQDVRRRSALHATATGYRKIIKSEQEWREQLTEDEYAVCREQCTERPFTGEYNDCWEDGVYKCKCCGEALFKSETKFDHGCGWPSFYEPISEDAVEEHEDNSLAERPRTEVVCTACGAHLGHVFPDGPEPTGERYCINSVAVKLEKDE